MASKRKLRPHDVVEEPPARPSLRRCGSDPIPNASDEAPAKPVYLVVEHEVEKPAYSLFKVDAASSDGPGDDFPASPPRHLALLHEAKHGMSFAAANSRHGSWVVGAGGAPGSWARDTIIYDPKSSKEMRGPWLGAAKSQPILVSLRDNLYAISRCPSVKLGDEFEPWFEVLGLTEGYPLRWMSSWKPLPPPPFFPCLLTPLEFKDPPKVCVTSYAVVGSCILLSLDKEKGTYAFDVEKEAWEKVSDKNLPFVGEAVPLGRFFFAHSKTNDAAALYDINLYPLSSSSMERALYIVESPVVASKSIASGQFFCSLGKGTGFCSFRVRSIDPDKEAKLERTRIVQHNYLMDDAKMDGTKPKLVKVKQWRRIYKVFDRSRHLARPTPLVAALTLDRE